MKYLGDTVINVPYSEDHYPEWNTYWLSYTLNNEDFKSKIYEEYLLYDVIDMIGSFGGTLGNNSNWRFYLHLHFQKCNF